MTLRDWTPEEQARHRAELRAALAGKQPPDPPCVACQDRRHGPDCAIATHVDGRYVRCGCTCRAVLGLTAFLDATAPEVADQVVEEVA